MQKKCLTKSTPDFFKKGFQQTRNRRDLPLPSKEHLFKNLAADIFHGEKLNDYPFEIRSNPGYVFSPSLFNIVLYILMSTVRQVQEVKCIQFKKMA